MSEGIQQTEKQIINNQHLCGQREDSTEQQENKKLEQFVVEFVSIFETQLSEYFDRLENGQKAGKWADLVNHVMSKVKVTSKIFEDPLTKVGVIIGLNVVKKGITSIGCKLNRDSTKKLLKHLYLYRSEPKQVKEALVKAGIEIFLCFESQFTQVTADGVWQRAIHKLAADAVSRVVNHLKNDSEEEFTTTSITKGVIQGESKTYQFKSIGIKKLLTPGHTLQFKNSESWNTAELFAQSGLVTIKDDGTVDKYYHTVKNDTSKYGYRRLFKWESEDELKTKCNEIERPKEEYTYVLINTDIVNLVKKMMEKISKDKGNIGKELLAQIKQEADDNFNALETFVAENFNQLLDELEQNQGEIIENFERISLQIKLNHEEDMEAHKKTQDGIDDLKEKIHNQERTKERKKKPVWFDVDTPVISFVPRQNMMKNISENLKTGIVVICGLGGMGKSELARKYAQDHSKDYNSNVIWINAKTQKTIRESCYRLVKDHLKTKINPKEEDEKPIDEVTKEIYEYFGHTKSLFILDNAESYDSIEPFLPSKLSPELSPPNVLITSQNNSDWECERIRFWPLSLHEFTDDEAIELVRHVLDAKDASQTKELTEFANKLYNFPLALNQASRYIKEKQKFSNYAISDFIKEFTKASKKLQEDRYLDTVFSTLKFTLGRITNAKSLEIIHVISYFESNQIPKKVLASLGGKFLEVIKDLVKYSIVRLDGDMVSVHGLVQKICRQILKDENKEFEILSKALGCLINKVKQFHRIISLRPHVISVWNHACINDKLIDIFIVKDIVEKKAHINFFHLLASGSSFEVFEMILNKIERDSSENFEKILCADDGKAGMPVHYAATNKDSKVLSLLIQKGAPINVKKDKGFWTPLHLAVQNCNHANVNVLLLNEIQIDARTELQFTSLHLAARNGYSEIVEMLVNNGADVNACCNRLFTPLHYAAKMNHIEVVWTLVMCPKIDINAQTEEGRTPLHYSAKSGDLECVQALLKNFADPNARDTGDCTPLHLAACFGHKEVVDAFLKRKEVDVNAQTSKKNTPLHLAAEKGHMEIVIALIAQNAKFDIRNEDGKLAVEMVHEKNEVMKNYMIELENNTKSSCKIQFNFADFKFR